MKKEEIVKKRGGCRAMMENDGEMDFNPRLEEIFFARTFLRQADKRKEDLEGETAHRIRGDCINSGKVLQGSPPEDIPEGGKDGGSQKQELSSEAPDISSNPLKNENPTPFVARGEEDEYW